jgi:DNA-binding transcriptional LysR family regulator
MPLSPTTPELAALDLFVSVVRLGSLSKAAAAHHIAQPSASSRIRNLERQLGVQLLERSPTGSRPTVQGNLVAGWAEVVLRSANELVAGVEALQAKEQGRLRIAASLTIAEYLLPPWLEQFLRNRPNDSIELEVANSAIVLQRLADGAADLGFVESPSTTPGMTEHVVATDRLIVVVGSNHPWRTRESIPLEALASTPLVLREQGSGTRESFEQFLDIRSLGPALCALELGSTAAVRAAVVHGELPTVISEHAVAVDLDAGSLHQIDVPGLGIERELRAVWPTSRPLVPLAQKLFDRLPHLGRSTVGWMS